MARGRTLGRTAILRGDDQRAGRAPTHCVISGVETADAVQVRAANATRAERWQLAAGYWLTARATRAAVPVTVAVERTHWRVWRLRLGLAIVVSSVGAGLAIVGAVRAQWAAVVIGVIVLGAGIALRAWFARVRWIGVRYDATRDLIVVSRTSRAFADDAQRLFAAALHRR